MKTDDSVIWWTAAFDSMVYVYDSSGSLLFWNDDVETWNSDAGLEAISLKAGDYTIQVGVLPI